ncbi:unnamed protein product [Adineta steineri]|uniref:G-protein coupled receptors family 1 profile domain-containing protein n=1 Tax=Adineta steineri TaxID=433720 RepID=A0A814Z3A4_9BILA|nr:unnamed protein product [Adineta steineri]
MSTSNNLSSFKQLEPCYILRPIGYYLIFLWVFGMSLNGSILYIFIRYKKLRQSSTNIFIGSLILTDFIGACFEIPMPAIALIKCRWIFGYVGCVFEAVIAYFSGCSNMYILCLLSMDRYFVVTRSFTATTITIKQTYTSILCAYIFALFWTLMPIIGWSSYDFEGTGASCSIKWEERSFNVLSYNMTILIFVYLIPVHEHRRSTNINFSASFIRRQLAIEHRVTYTVIFIIGGFLLAWTPYAISVFIRVFIDEHLLSPLSGTIPAIFAKTSVVWNPFIYIIRNGNFRRFLPVFAYHRIQKKRKSSNPTHFSVYPYSAVHLPLPASSNVPGN